MAIAPAILAGCTPPKGTTKPLTKEEREGPPKLDTSSDDALYKSMTSIRDKLTESRQQEFADDCDFIMGKANLKPARNKAANPDERDKGHERSILFKSIDGLNADQIRDRAEAMRAEIQTQIENEKAANERLVEQAKKSQPTPPSLAEIAEGKRQADRAKVAADLAAKKSPEAVAKRASEEIKRAAANDYGADADITVFPPEVETLVGDKWKVKGRLVALGKGGAELKAYWVAMIGFTLGELYLEDRSIVEDRPTPTRRPSAAPGSPKPNGKPKSNGKPTASPKDKPTSPADRAAEALSRAKAIEEAGRFDEALKLYQGLIKSYPGTPSAGKAGERADALLGRPRKK